MSARGWPRTTAGPWVRGLVALVAAVCCAGCQEGLDDVYGQRAGPRADKSVNGTRVLGDMFERAGHRVYSWRSLSPNLQERADCIVWFPDDFGPPSEEVCCWLEHWLSAEPGRLLIYVGRDFDAAPWYWEKIEPHVPAEKRLDYEEHRRRAKDAFALRRALARSKQGSRWFSIDRREEKREVRTLSGDPEWIAEIDPSKVDIELHGRFVPSDGATVLLDSEGDMLISREAVDDSQLVVVTNGSFLLNLPLVNHEHRKLAGKLIDMVEGDEQTVVFLESNSDGPSIADDDPVSGAPTGAEIFNVWPTNWILLHLAVIGILFCFWRFPIFGFARQGEPARLSDFGKHLDAVAKLLKQSHNEEYARRRLREYLHKTKTTD